MYSGDKIEWWSSVINKTPLLEFFNEVIFLFPSPEQLKEDLAVVTHNISFKDFHGFGAEASGYATGAYGNVNKSFEEEKFHAKQGHGFAAERANNLFDKLTGNSAYVVGDDNKANGADRVLNGVEIQSKYCQTGEACINECFDKETKLFRYFSDGKPMRIEVPSDKYDAAVAELKRRIEDGSVPGVSDPNEAEHIVKKGHFTYEQAKRIAKAGTIESLTYDAITGSVIAASAFGVTAVISFATSIWNGSSVKVSLKYSAVSGLKVGGTAFLTTLIAGQLSRAGLNSAMVSSSKAFVAFMGPDLAAKFINAFRNGSNIYGAAAMKSAAKLLRGNIITVIASFVVLSSVDIFDVFSGKISKQQLLKNLTKTGAAIAGGSGGWVAGVSIGSLFGPGPGTIIGGIIGSFIGGMGAGKISSLLMNKAFDDDSKELLGTIESEFNRLSEDYLLTCNEAEKAVDILRTKLSAKQLKRMFAAEDREKFADDIIEPIFTDLISRRVQVPTPDSSHMLKAIVDLVDEGLAFCENQDSISILETGNLRSLPFSMPIEDVFYIKGRGTVITGKIKTGQISVNDKINLIKDNIILGTTVKGIEMFRKLLDQAESGDNVGLLLSDVKKNQVKKGMIASSSIFKF